MSTHNNPTRSNTTQSLVELLLQRDQAGQKKYGTSLDRADLGPEDWAQHAIEETLDLAGYLSRFGQTVQALRAENLRLAEENVRLRAMLAPILELARTLDVEPVPAPQQAIPGLPCKICGAILIPTNHSMICPTDGCSGPFRVHTDIPTPQAAPILEFDVEPAHESPVSFTDPKRSVQKPAESMPVGMTAHEIAAALGCHKDSIHNYKKAGLLPEPVPGTGGHPHNPQRYVVDIEELREKVKARQEAAKVACLGKIRKPAAPEKATPPAPTFDINENGRYEAIEHGRSFFRPDKAFDLWRICEASGYQWRVVGRGQSGIGTEGGEVVEHWRLNGLGQWESTPVIPGAVGTRNGTTQGAGGYKVPVLG